MASKTLFSQTPLHIERAVEIEEMISTFFDDSTYLISNVNYLGDRNTRAYFEGVSTDLGLNGGIVLSTGLVDNLIPPQNPDVTISVDINGSSQDDLLDLFDGVEITDASMLEFDIMPVEDMEIELKYKFGSDEYNHTKNQDFDVFGIFVEGPGFEEPTNIALVPNTNTPVSINSINVDSNSTYYINYAEDGGTDCSLNGFTSFLTATFSAKANENYTIKIAIADNFDDKHDSAIFLDVTSLKGEGFVNPIANFDFEFLANKVQVDNLSRYATSFQLDFGNGDVFENEIPFYYDYPQVGTYEISMIAQNYWFSDTFSSNIVIETLNYDSLTSNLYIDHRIDVEDMVVDFFDSPQISLSNISHTGASSAKGYFEAALTDLGIPAGIILSTGSVTNAIGPSEQEGKTTSYQNQGDIDLDSYANATTRDASILQFDLLSNLDDTLVFSYVFASEEYNEFVDFDFNDLFAFFVSGGRYEELTNIATIGNSEIPVQIDNINLNNNSELYRNYAVENGLHFEYDGLTVVLEANFIVEKNVTYHLKIGIADVEDDIVDSAIFLGVESLNGDSLVTPPAALIVSMVENEIQVTNNSKYATSYEWDFGDGKFSNERNPLAHSYNQEGVYDLTLKTFNYCCTDSFHINIPIGSAEQDTFLCQGENSLVLDNIQPGLNQVGQWRVIIGSGEFENSTEANTRIVDLAKGTNLIEWEIIDTFNNVEVFKDTLIVEVDVILDLEIDLDELNSCLFGDRINLAAEPMGGIFSGKGVEGHFFDPLIAGIGSHQIEYLYTSQGGCTSNTSIVIEVVPSPVAEFSISKDLVCENTDPLPLVADSIHGVFEGNGVLGNTFDPKLAGVGNHNIMLTVSNDFGCTDTSTMEINVVEETPVTFTIDSTICGNDDDIILEGSPEGGSFTLLEDSLVVLSPKDIGEGIYELTYNYTDENGCVSSYVQSVKFILAPLQPEIIHSTNDSIKCSITGENYLWYLDGDLLSQNTQSIIHEIPGLYTVIVEQSGCFSSLSEAFLVSKTIDPIFEKLIFYPNPVDDLLTIQNDSSQEFHVEILDSKGRQVFVFSKGAQTKTHLSIDNFENGVYFLRVLNESKPIAIRKLVVLHR